MIGVADCTLISWCDRDEGDANLVISANVSENNASILCTFLGATRKTQLH